MMIKCLILDLDGTLMDTSALAGLRESGRWGEISHNVHLCSPYSQVVDVLHTARAEGIKISIVTNAPSNYAQKLLNHFGLKVDYLVAYHDVRNKKPDKEGVEKVLSRFGLRPEEAVFLGDSLVDCQAAQAAKVEYFSVDWSDPSMVTADRFGVCKLLEYIGTRNSDANSRSSEILQAGNHFFLGYYLGGIKQEIWAFKDGTPSAIARWLKKAQEVSSLLPRVDYVVRALGHDELQIGSTGKESPLDQLSEHIAWSLNATYRGSCLAKDRVLVKSTQCSARERKLQVDGAYSVSREGVGASTSSPLTFLIVDDVLTSGATTREITRALNADYPQARIYIFTLVKTLFGPQADEATAEAQHNSQLFIDLYRQTNMQPASFADAREPGAAPARRKTPTLVTKRYSANYAKTSHNFVFQNIKSFSIAAEPESRQILSAVYIVRNMLQRGKPTIASRKLRQAFGCDIHFGCHGDEQALISRKPVTWRRLIRGDIKADRYPAKRFFDELIPKYFGDYAFIKQLTLPEVQIFDMTRVYVDRFNNHQVDFYIPQAGLIIEIDGPQHRNTQESDDSRDAFTRTLGIKTVRFTTEEIAGENRAFLDKVTRILDHLRYVDELESQGILVPPNGLTLQHYKKSFHAGIDRSCPSFRLTAAIRFQLLLLELIESGDIRLGQRSRILLINRDDIDFAQQAVEDLGDYLKELMALFGVEDRDLNVQVTEVQNAQSVSEEGGIKVDFSILERFDDTFQEQLDTVFVRTDYFDFYRYFSGGDATRLDHLVLEDYDYFEIACAEPVTYYLDLSPDSRQRSALRFFLSNLFLPLTEDPDFREGQVGIIGSALARRGTIGLLPTGSGKSICYQLTAILQPSVSFVVCPIKSLMYDQKADLDSIGFTRCNFITSDLRSDQKAKVQREYGQGKYFFVFISPERFQTRHFRSEMRAIGLDRSFAYAVIDEAHCLSEWGHDFRTSYLNLSTAIRRLAPDASYIGLTATASVNVLKDIQTEFGVPDENVRTPLDFAREELTFHVIDDKGRKHDAALSLVKDMECKWNATQPTKAGIIFTPTVNGDKGCFLLAGRLSKSLGMDVHYFSGSAPQAGNLRADAFEAYKQNVQRDFKANKYRLLTATKAFGMGVNKGNIAYTIHFGIPGSMEALYQEAGRAGRDKKLFSSVPADCYVLLTREKNTDALDKIWDSSARVTDLKDNLKQLTRESDINTNLWLLTNGLDTINDEYKLIAKIYAYLEKNRDMQTIVVTASQFATDKFKFERAVYRLSQLGIVSDWMVEDFFRGKLEIEFSCVGDDQLRTNLETTIRKYEPTFRLSDLLASSSEFYVLLNDRLKKGALDQTQYIFLVLLVWSYDHFVYNRRQSLKTVYEQCSDLAAGKIGEDEFKLRLEGYFKLNNSTHVLHSLAENATDSTQWLSIFFDDSSGGETKDIIGSAELVTLKEQLARFLESYKDNACLNYISGILRLASDQFDDADGERRMSRSLDQLANRPMEEIEKIVTETVKLKPLFSIDSQCRFARLFHERFPEMRILELINSGFKDPYSYRKLLEPLTPRLANAISKFRGITWS